jgi:ketosteroid isomerase-like protein
MKKAILISILVGTIFSAGGVASAREPSVQQQLQPILNEMMLAAKAHDTDRFTAVYLHQPGLVFVFDGKVIHGWDELREQQLQWWRHGKTDVVYTQNRPVEFTQLSREAVVTTQSMSSRRKLPDGKVSTGSFVVTDVWQKLPQGWQIVYSHESWER